MKKTPGQTYTGREDSSLAQLEFQHNKYLLMETRAPNEEFSVSSDYTLKVARVSKGERYEEQQAVDVPLPNGTSLGHLQQACAAKFGIPLDRVCIVKVIGTAAKVLEGNIYLSG